MRADEFLRSKGPVCVRCGLPAVVRYGVDLVEPDSGMSSCAECCAAVRMGLTILLTCKDDEAKALAESFLKLNRSKAKKAKAERERVAAEMGWRTAGRGEHVR